MNHGNNIINNILDHLANLSHIRTTCLSLTVYFIADAIFLSPLHSASHTHTSLSLCYLALFPSLSVWYKIPGKYFNSIIDRNKLFWYTSLFRLEVAHNNVTFKQTGGKSLPRFYLFFVIILIPFFKVFANVSVILMTTLLLILSYNIRLSSAQPEPETEPEPAADFAIPVTTFTLTVTNSKLF